MNEHEHHFIVETIHWETSQATFTVRFCQTCGLMHRLVWRANPTRWQLELIPEVEQDIFTPKPQEQASHD